MDVYFTVASETLAEKTQRLLSRYRYPFHVNKMTGKNGCSYRFRVSGNADAVTSLLTAHGIAYQLI